MHIAVHYYLFQGILKTWTATGSCHEREIFYSSVLYSRDNTILFFADTLGPIIGHMNSCIVL